MPVVTRSNSIHSTMPASSYTDVGKKLDSSSLSSETKQIFRLVIELFKSVTSTRDTKVAELDQKFAMYQSKSDEKIKDLQQQTDNLKQDVETAATENKNLRDEVRLLRNSQDEQDAYVRRESLIFSGSKVKPSGNDEDCSKVARELIRNVLQLQIEPPISTAHRMGKPPVPGAAIPDKRDIVVRFCSRDDKFKILKAARTKKVEGLFVNESLTPTRKTVHYVLRQIRKIKNGPVTGVTTHNGRVFVHSKPAPNAPEGARNVRTEINSMDKLKDFCTNFVKKPLESFLARSEPTD